MTFWGFLRECGHLARFGEHLKCVLVEVLNDLLACDLLFFPVSAVLSCGVPQGSILGPLLFSICRVLFAVVGLIVDRKRFSVQVPCATLHDVIDFLVEKTEGVLTPLIIEQAYEKNICTSATLPARLLLDRL